MERVEGVLEATLRYRRCGGMVYGSSYRHQRDVATDGDGRVLPQRLEVLGGRLTSGSPGYLRTGVDESSESGG